MEHFITVKDILKVTKGELLYGDKNIVCENFCKDTREIKAGDIYLGIKGENFDGNFFYEEAFQKGAKGCIVEKITNLKEKENTFLIRVPNTILAMQAIASYKRSLYHIPVIAVTGSVGKTSTKDMIAGVLGESYKVLKTQGNYNNHIGLPLTLLQLKDHTAVVVEMGMNNFGEIRTLTNIAKPTIAVIVNIGTSHIGILGSRENILKAKLEVLEGLKKNGTVIINNDNDLLHQWQKANQKKYTIKTYGIENASEVMAENIMYDQNGSNYTLKGSKEKVTVPIGGSHFVSNSLCAVAVGKLFHIPMEKIKAGIVKFELSKKRMDVKQVKGYTIINDCYNATYDSMKAVLEYMEKWKNERKIAVLGDMLELGDYSLDLHEKVGIEVAKNKIDVLITVGENAKQLAEKAKEMGVKEVYSFMENQKAISKLKEIKKEGDVILVKASHSMKFHEIVESIE